MARKVKISSQALARDSAAYLIVEAVIRIVAQGLGKAINWNGKIYTTTDGVVESASHADGGLTFNSLSVIEVIEDALAGDRVDAVELRSAVDTVVHAAIDLSVDTTKISADHGASLALNEGAVRLLTDSVLDDVIRQLGLDQTVPEIMQVQSAASYSIFATATQPLIRELSRKTGMLPRQVLTEIARADMDQKFAVVGSLALQAVSA